MSDLFISWVMGAFGDHMSRRAGAGSAVYSVFEGCRRMCAGIPLFDIIEWFGWVPMSNVGALWCAHKKRPDASGLSDAACK